MLEGINPILTGDLLKALSDMGLGDEIVIADGNFASTGDSIRQAPIWVPSINTVEVVKAILTVFPLDNHRLAWPGYITETWDSDQEAPSAAAAAFIDLFPRLPGAEDEPTQRIAREEFHGRARQAYAIVATADPRHYACFILRKGAVSGPDGSGNKATD